MFERRLQELGLELPPPPKPLASYVPALEVASLLYISGQLPFLNGKLIHTGKVPDEVAVEAAQQAARQCLLNALAIVRDHLSTLDRVVQLVRLSGYVASSPQFYQQPLVINGASELLADIFGAAGKHTRIAVGVVSLPLNAPVELDLILAVKS
jgi:enamine deaminase RidA (YjgF/YER057c/UK114 family)